MKTPSLILLLLVFTLPPQTVEPENSDLTVVKFSWAKDKPKSSSMIRGAQNPTGSISTPITGDRDLASRRADMQVMEKKAVRSSAAPGGDGYLLRLELKNTSAKIVRGLIWEFKPTAGPADYEPKQYLCAFRVEANEKKKFEVWTPYAPVKVVSVDERANALKDGEVIINRIDYADGSVWKKRGWNYNLPAGASQKLSEGQCSVF